MNEHSNLETQINMEPTTLNTSPRTSFRALLLLPLAAVSLSLLAGCHKKASGVDPSSLGPTNTSDANTVPPPTATLTGDPVSIELGQTVVLNWRTMNATTVSIDGIGQVNTSGTQTVSPSNSTNFHLVAKGDGGTTEANFRVTVRVPTVPSGGTTSMDSDTGSDSAFHAAVKDVYFDYDSIELRPDAQQAAAGAASYLTQHPGIRVLIGGYCDERGSAEYNLALGENRANAAKSALVNAGVAPTRIRVISYGKEKQFCSEASEACYQENRRAQFTIDK
jgi:peptidoglycan-associated lipoprotein